MRQIMALLFVDDMMLNFSTTCRRLRDQLSHVRGERGFPTTQAKLVREVGLVRIIREEVLKGVVGRFFQMRATV